MCMLIDIYMRVCTSRQAKNQHICIRIKVSINPSLPMTYHSISNQLQGQRQFHMVPRLCRLPAHDWLQTRHKTAIYIISNVTTTKYQCTTHNILLAQCNHTKHATINKAYPSPYGNVLFVNIMKLFFQISVGKFNHDF